MIHGLFAYAQIRIYLIEGTIFIILEDILITVIGSAIHYVDGYVRMAFPFSKIYLVIDTSA